MELHHNQLNHYAYVQSNALKDCNDTFYWSRDYLLNISRNSKMLQNFISMLSSDSFEVNISDIEREIVTLSQLFTKIIDFHTNSKGKNEQLSNLFSLIKNHLTMIGEKIRYLKKNISKKYSIGNVIGLNDIYTKLQTSILCLEKIWKNKSFENINKYLEEIIEILITFNGIVNRIIDFNNIFKQFQYKYLCYLKKCMNVLDKLSLNKSLDSISIKSYLIDQNKNIILEYSQNIQKDSFQSDKNKNNTKYLLSNIENKYIENIETLIKCSDIKNSSQSSETERKYNINDYIIDETIKFSNKISDIKKKIEDQENPIKVSLKLLDLLLSDYCQYTDNTKMSFSDQTISNNRFISLFNIAKSQLFLKGSTIINTINSIFRKNREHVSQLTILKSYDEIYSILKDFYLAKKNRLPNYSIEKMIDEVQQEGNFFYLDRIFKIIIKNMFEERIHLEQAKSIKIKAKNGLSFSDSSCRLIFDKDLGFVLQKKYTDECNQAEKKREKDIMTRNYSKFIVHIKNSSETMITFPYYPNETLNRLFSKTIDERIFLSFVDKIVIILEIATALKDLHSHNIFHGNLCSNLIVVDSNKDAYLGGFYYDKSNEQNNSKQDGPFLYRPPESLKNKNMGTKAQKLFDIYSFGILMHEIVTETNIESRKKGMNISKFFEILTENYFEFLFSGKNNEYFDEKQFIIDEFGNCMIGMKEIIEKCMKKNSEERYSSFKELIEDIHTLTIYEKNKEEIEYRLFKANDSTKYKCKISDLICSYYQGQISCKKDIEKYLSVYQNKSDLSTENKDNIDMIQFVFESLNIKLNEDVSSIIDLLEKKPISFDEYWIQFFTKANLKIRQDGESFMRYVERIYKISGIRNEEILIKQLNSKFRFLFKSDDSREKTIDEIMEQIQYQRKYYLLDDLYQSVFKYFFDQEYIISKYTRLYEDGKEFVYICGKEKEDKCIDAAFKLCFDYKMRFYYQKTYLNGIDERIIRREKKILNENYSKYIVHAVNNQEGNGIIIPYFPFGTLNEVLNSEPKIILTFVDKIVILLEIATALNDLHSHDQYHGDICSHFIHLSSNKNAYIINFCYDKKSESQATELKGPFYYRSKESMEALDESVNTEQKNDIYSFGVLFHEVITEINPETRLKNMQTMQRIKILNEYYYEFLFSKSNDDFFSKGPKEDMDIIKNIIGKCMKQNPEERYSSFKDLINDIRALPFYKQNREEIEFRLKNAEKSDEYQCSLSNLVESYYRGHAKSKNDVDLFLSTYQQTILKSQYNSLIFPSDENIVKRIFDMLICDLSTIDGYWSTLFKISEYKSNGSFIVDMINYIFNHYNIFIGDSPRIKMMSKFLAKINGSNVDINMFKQEIEELLEQNKFYLFDSLASQTAKKILNRKSFVKIFKELSDIIYKTNDTGEYFFKDEIIDFNDCCISFKIFFDHKMNFYLEKKYNNTVEKEIERDVNILNSKYSKFIVQYAYKDQDRIVIPYYPMRTFYSLITNKHKNINHAHFSFVDKIVMILEIVTALQDLHLHDEYHGNLCSQFVYIDSNKDAYLGNFCFDRNNEASDTKPKGPLYYRPPEIFDLTIFEKNEEDEKYIKKQQKIDIYSIGVLMHEFITEKSPIDRMGNMPRKQRICTIKYNYIDFLFSGDNNEYFDEANYLFDEYGNCMNGMKEIIEKCMKKNSEERYSSFKELIEDIHTLTIYEKNKEEIEYRLFKANDSTKYKCKISDLICSYYQGQISCKKDIENFLSAYLQILNGETSIDVSIQDDVINEIMKCFNIKLDEDDTFYFKEIFDIIVQKFYHKKISPSKMINMDDWMLTLSIEENAKNQENIDFIIPVCTLYDFINNNENKYERFLIIWMYFIAKELSFIHSNNLYHGDLSLQNIGLYYNKKTKTLIPSAILYYSYYKIKQNYFDSCRIEVPSKLYSHNEKTSKMQRKDIKKFASIFKEFDIIPDIVFEQFDSMSLYVHYLYNFINKNYDEDTKDIFYNNYKNHDYPLFQITFTSMKDIFHLFQKNKYSFNDLIINFDEILKKINNFLDNAQSNPDLKLIECIQLEQIKVEDKVQEDEKNEFEIINAKCNSLYVSIKQHENEDQKELIMKPKRINNIERNNNFEIENYIIDKLDQNKRKVSNLITKPIYKTLEFIVLTKRSFQFLLRRSLLSLNPFFKYRIKILFNSPRKFEFRYDIITLEDVQQVVQKDNRLSGEITVLSDGTNGFQFFLKRIVV